MITSTKNARIVQARKLIQRKHRARQNRFLVEGLQLLGMAVEMKQNSPAGHKIIPGELFYSEALFSGDTAPRLLSQLTRAGAEPVPVAPHVLDTLSERDTSQGLTATFALRELSWSLDELAPILAARPALVLLLDQLQDPGNLGTLIRTADAVGAAAVILIEPCVDPFDPKTVRGSMGSLFNVPLVRTGDVPTLFDWLHSHDLQPVGADVHQGKIWGQDLWRGSVGLILGNEARGLSEDVYEYVKTWVRLPIAGKAESLNVAVAGGVLMYAWLRENLEKEYGSK